MDYDVLLINAHTQIHKGTGGQPNTTQELHHLWMLEIAQKEAKKMMNRLDKWQYFTCFYSNKIKGYNREGITTAKAKQINSIINQEQIHEHFAANFVDTHDQLEYMSRVMSIQTQTHSPKVHSPVPSQQPGIPPVIQTAPSFASALTSEQSHRLLMDKRIQNDKEKQALIQQINTLEKSIATATASMTTCTSPPAQSTSKTTTDQRIKQKDLCGNNWFQVGHYCSKHGYSISHTNDNCRDRNKMETAKGHPKLQQQHVQSTKYKPPRSNKHSISTHLIEVKNQVSVDITGRYTITSSRRGNKYILIMIDWDSNYIKLIVSLKSRNAESYVTAYQEGYNWFLKHGFQSEVLKIDNEISDTLIQASETDKLQYQLASPDDYQQLPAERVIQDVKAHFISIRSIADHVFPADGWDLLLQHTEDTLNMLRPSKLNPLVSACTTVRGYFDYMKTPVAPAGYKVIVHDRPNTRGSPLSDRGTEGYFISQAPEHY